MSDGENPLGVGHNSAAVEQLRAFVERYERLEKEKQEIAEDQKEVLVEAKSCGYDTKVLRKVIRLRKLDRNQVIEEASVLNLYCEALGLEFLIL